MNCGDIGPQNRPEYRYLKGKSCWQFHFINMDSRRGGEHVEKAILQGAHFRHGVFVEEIPNHANERDVLAAGTSSITVHGF